MMLAAGVLPEICRRGIGRSRRLGGVQPVQRHVPQVPSLPPAVPLAARGAVSGAPLSGDYPAYCRSLGRAAARAGRRAGAGRAKRAFRACYFEKPGDQLPRAFNCSDACFYKPRARGVSHSDVWRPWPGSLLGEC